MSLVICSSSFLIPELLLLTSLPLSRILMGEWSQSRKYLNYSLRFTLLHNAASQWVGKATYDFSNSLILLLVSIVKSALHSTPLFTILKTPDPLSEVCLCDHINCPLAQAQQQSFLGLSQSFTSARGDRTRLRTGFQFHVQKWPEVESSGSSMAKKPHISTRMESHHSDWSLWEVVQLPVSPTPWREALGDDILNVLQCTTSSTSSSSVVQVGTLPHFLINGDALLSIGLC